MALAEVYNSGFQTDKAAGQVGDGWIDITGGGSVSTGQLHVRNAILDPNNMSVSHKFWLFQRPDTEATNHNKFVSDVYVNNGVEFGIWLRLTNGISTTECSGLLIRFRASAGFTGLYAVYYEKGVYKLDVGGSQITPILPVNALYKIEAEISGSNPVTLSVILRDASNNIKHQFTSSLTTINCPDIQGVGTIGLCAWDAVTYPMTFDNMSIYQDDQPVAPSAPAIVLHPEPDYVVSDTSALYLAIKDMPEQTWLKVSGGNTASSQFTPPAKRVQGFAGYGDAQASTLSAWSCLAVLENKMIAWGEGHANGIDNFILYFDFNDCLWKRGSLPTNTIQVTGTAVNECVTTDNGASPVASHCYQNTRPLKKLNRVFTGGGAGFNSGAAIRRSSDGSFTAASMVTTGPYLLDPALMDANNVGSTGNYGVDPADPYSGCWQNRDWPVNIPSQARPAQNFASGVACSTVINGEDVVFMSIMNDGLYKWTVKSATNLTTDTITKIGANPNIAIQGVAAYDDYTKKFIRTGTSSDTYNYYYWNTGLAESASRTILPVNRFTNGTGGRMPVSSMPYSGMTFNPHNNEIAVTYGGNLVYMLKQPRHGVQWELVIDNPGATTGPGGSLDNDLGAFGSSGGILGKWNYSLEYRVYVLLKDATLGDVWVYKPRGWVDPTAFQATDTITVSQFSNKYTNAIAGYALYSASTAEGLATAAIAATITAEEAAFSHPRATSGKNYYTVKAFDIGGVLYSSASNFVESAAPPITLISIEDNAAGSDVLSATITLSILDTATGADAFTGGTVINLTDAGVGADSLSVAVSVAMLENSTGSDAINSYLSVNIADAAVSVDALTNTVSVTLTDNGSGNDAITITASLTFADNAEGVDSLVLQNQLAISDSASGLDVVVASERSNVMISNVVVTLQQRKVTFKLIQQDPS